MMKMTVRRMDRPREVGFALRIKATAEGGKDLQLIAETFLESDLADKFDLATVYDIRLIEQGPV
jgi:hypothetical protein